MTRTSASGPAQPVSPVASGPSAPANERETHATRQPTSSPQAESSNPSRKRRVPAQEPARAKRLRASLAANRTARFFSNYRFAQGIVLPPELRPSHGRGMRGSTTLGSVLAHVVAGPELDARLIPEFDLRDDLGYRFAEIRNGRTTETALLGYAEDRREIAVAYRVEFDPNAIRFSRTDASEYGRELARNMELAADQAGMAGVVRINGNAQFMLVARNASTGRIETVHGLGPYTDIAPAARGFMTRRDLRQQAQASTPYPDFGTYLFATHNLRHDRLAGNGDENASAGKRSKDEWDLYRSSISIELLEEPYAYIYSAKKLGDLTRELKRRGVPNSRVPEKISGIGHIYVPERHSMRTNTAWLLGLAHRSRPVVMATPLEEATLVRFRAPPGGRSVDTHMSAFLREIVAMLRDGFFTVSEDEHGKTIFHPTGKARTATLDQMLTPPGMPREEVEAFLARYRLSIAPDRPAVHEPRNAFDFEEWAANLLLQDLEDQGEGFPRLDLCVRAGVAMPAGLFREMPERLTTEAPQMKERLTAMLCRMVESVGDDTNAADALLHASSALPKIETEEGRNALVGLIYGKALSLRSARERNRVRAMLAADVVATELRMPGDTGFSLARLLCTLHAPRPAHSDAAAGEPMFPVGRITLAAIVQATDLAPDAAEKPLGMLRFLLQTGEGTEPNPDALISLARELPYFRSEALQSDAMRLAVDAARLVRDPETKQDALFFIGQAMVIIEARRPNPEARALIEALHQAGILIDPDLVGAAAGPIARAPDDHTENLSFIRTLIDSLPGATLPEKALIRIAEALPEVRTAERLDRFLAMLFDEAESIGVPMQGDLSRAVCLNLLRKQEDDHERTLHRLEPFGIAPGPALLVDVLRTIDAPQGEHGGSLCRLAIEIVNRIPADQRADVMGDVLFCFQSRPFLPEKLVLLDVVLEHIALSASPHDEAMSLAQQVVKALDTAQDDLMTLPDAPAILRSARSAIPELFESDPALAFARLELAETDTQREQILDGLLEELSHFEHISAERIERALDMVVAACERMEDRERRTEALERFAAILERDNISAEPWAIKQVLSAIPAILSKKAELSLRGMKTVMTSIERVGGQEGVMYWPVMHDIGTQLDLPPGDRSIADLLRDAREEIARREVAATR